MWSSHQELEGIIKNSWQNQNDILKAIPIFTNNVTEWNTKIFGNIFKRKRTILNRIGGIQRSQHYLTNFYLQQLEVDLIKEYNLILCQEEDFWKLKSRINWLNEGDANICFFSHLNPKSKKE